MRKVSTKTAARAFFSVLKDADKSPVIIERHGRPRAAVVSIRRFQLYEKLIARYSEELSLALLTEAVEEIAGGHLGEAAKLREDARFFRKFAAPASDHGDRP